MTEPIPPLPPIPPKTLPLAPTTRGSGESDRLTPAVVEIDGLVPGRRFALDREVTTIGRSDENHLVLASPAVSTQHARIARRDSQFWIEDLDSTNGVQINGANLTPHEPRVLSQGDTIRISDHLLLFHRGSISQGAGGAAAGITVDQEDVRRQVDALLNEFPGLRNPRRTPR